jgi:hypothetical protein
MRAHACGLVGANEVLLADRGLAERNVGENGARDILVGLRFGEVERVLGRVAAAARITRVQPARSSSDFEFV